MANKALMKSEKNPMKGLRAKIGGVSGAMGALAATASVALAANPFTNAETTIKTLFTNLQAALTNIVVPIAACAFIFCLIMMLVSQNQKKVETYRSWLITIFVCVIGIFAVSFVITLAQTIGNSF